MRDEGSGAAGAGQVLRARRSVLHVSPRMLSPSPSQLSACKPRGIREGYKPG